MKKAFTTFSLATITFLSFAQHHYDFIFTGINSSAHIQLEKVKVINRTQECDTILHWPDTVLTIQTVGILESDILPERLTVFQNQPNPFTEQSTIAVFVPDSKRVLISITTPSGSRTFERNYLLGTGMHKFRLTGGQEKIYFFTAIAGHEKSTIKVICNNLSQKNRVSITYDGEVNRTIFKQEQNQTGFVFSPGDHLTILGYYDTLVSGTMDYPYDSKTYSLQFAYGTACPGIPEFEYGGRTYQTVQIFNQCWMKSNLAIGEMIPGDDEMQDNGIFEKYCYDDFVINCDYFGALYQWDEVMNYSSAEGAQGICPDGWHIPTDEEWKILEGSVDNKYKVGDTEWDEAEFRGLDAAHQLKYTSYWNNNLNGSNASGFSLFPTGERAVAGFFYGSGTITRFWTSTLYSGLFGINPRDRHFYFTTSKIGRQNYMNEQEYGYAVRCVKDADD